MRTKIVADDILFLFFFSKIRYGILFERQTIHMMKCQALFSLKQNKNDLPSLSWKGIHSP